MAKNIFRGQTTVNNIYRGNTPLSKVYRGQSEIWSAAEAGPPVTADVFYWDANDYTSGNWVDRVNSWSATAYNSPTTGGTTGAKYITTSGGSDPYFVLLSADKPDKIWPSQGTAAAIGSMEYFVNMRNVDDDADAFSSWGSTNSQRNFIFQGPQPGGSGAILDAGGNVGLGSSTPLTTTGIWYHVVHTWDQSSDAIMYVNGSSVASKGSSWSGVWDDNDTSVGILARDTGQRITKGDAATFRGYTFVLSPTQVSDLYTFWSSIYT
jgi:hypothetical protein